MNEHMIGRKLLAGEYHSDKEAWQLAMSSEFCAGVGYWLGLRSPSDLGGRRSGILLRVPGEDMYVHGRRAQRQRILGYRWARLYSRVQVGKLCENR